MVVAARRRAARRSADSLSHPSACVRLIVFVLGDAKCVVVAWGGGGGTEEGFPARAEDAWENGAHTSPEQLAGRKTFWCCCCRRASFLFWGRSEQLAVAVAAAASSGDGGKAALFWQPVPSKKKMSL